MMLTSLEDPWRAAASSRRSAPFNGRWQLDPHGVCGEVDGETLLVD